jgi:hypothetical protein
VSRFPHHSLIMALPFLLIPPMSLLIILFHEHHLLALMMLILPAYQTGFYLQTNPYNATHHQRTTTLFHTSLHLTFPTLMMSLESSHTIRRYIILPHTTHTPSPWPVSPHSVHLQQRTPSYPQLMSCGLHLQSALGASRVVKTLLSQTRCHSWIQTAMIFLFYPSPLTTDSNIAPTHRNILSLCDPLLLTQLLRLLLHLLHDVCWSRSCGPLDWATAVNGNLSRSHCMLTARHPNFFLTHYDLLIIRNRHVFVSNQLGRSRNKPHCRDSGS